MKDLPIGDDFPDLLATYLKEEGSQLPPFVIVALQLLNTMIAKSHKSNASADTYFRAFLIAIGALSSSERKPKDLSRRAPKKPKKNKDPAVDAQLQLEYLGLRTQYLELHINECKEEKNALEQKLAENGIKIDPSSSAQKATSWQEATAFPMGGCQNYSLKLKEALMETPFEVSPELESVIEDLSCGFSPVIEEDQLLLEVEPERLAGDRVLDTLESTHHRYGFNLTLTHQEVIVEKKIVERDGERVVISPDLSDLGPPRSQINWNFLANLVTVSSQLYIPFNRLSMMLSTPQKTFTTPTLAQWYCRSAEHLAPIYVQLMKSLANAYIISGDDTTTRCLEVNKELAALKANPEHTASWEAYADPDRAKELLGNLGQSERSDWDRDPQYLGAFIGSFMKFRSEYLKFPDKAKRGFNTTVASGRLLKTRPDSLIVIFKSHFGSFGNFIKELLPLREDKTKLIIQSDMASANRILSPEIIQKYNISFAGCMAHARRPFFIHKGDDPVYMKQLLLYFSELSFNEDMVDRMGRNFEKLSQVRNTTERALWEGILCMTRFRAEQWSKETPLGSACRYIETYFKELTLYLDEPYLDPTNNLQERLLRAEKKIQDNAYFRKTLRGRFAVDVNRSILQTATAAGININAYLNHIYRVPSAKILANPEKYTPMAYGDELC